MTGSGGSALGSSCHAKPRGEAHFGLPTFAVRTGVRGQRVTWDALR